MPRPQRIAPSDAALVNGQVFSAVGQVKQNASGLNFPAVPFTLNAAQSQTSALLDVSGYTNFVLYVTHSANSGAHLNVLYVDPTDASTIMTGVNAGSTSATGATITPIPFGKNGIAGTNVPCFLIKLQLVGDQPGSITYISSLLCGT